MNITNSRGLHLNPTSPCPIPTSPCPIPTSPSSLPSTTHKPLPRSHNAKRKPSSWADQTDECKYNKTNKKQRLAQIMHWTPTQKPKPHPTPSPKPNTTKQYEHKDGDKLGNSVLVALGDEKRVDSVNMEDEGSVNITNNYNMNLPDACDAQPRDAQSCDTQPCDAQSCDSHSCDSHSTLSSDLMSCDTLSSCDSNFGEHDGEKDGEQKRKQKKKTKKSSKKKRCSTAEEGKKVFVGGIKFEDCDAMLSNQNETLETLRHQKFTHIFYLFGAVMRIQGHWNNGYCFVVFATKRAARLAIRCLSYAPVRKRIVQNLQDGVGPTGILPLPSFYLRWANNPNNTPRPTPTSSPLPVSLIPSSSPPSTSPLSLSPFAPSPLSTSPHEDPEEMRWLNGIKEEDMREEEVERLMQELVMLRD